MIYSKSSSLLSGKVQHVLRLLLVVLTYAIALPSYAALTCAVDVTPLNFGSFSPLGTSFDVSGTLTLRCTNSGAATVSITTSISASPGASADAFSRQMAGGAGGQLAYQLRRNTSAGSSGIWADGANAFSVELTVPVGGTRSEYRNYYGRMSLPQRSVIPGLHSDLVIVTVEY